MAINYELLNKGGISLGTNFELLSEKPLDSRLVVPSLDGLQNYIDNAAAYEGLIAYVSSEKKHYEVKVIDGVLSYRPFGLTEAELNDLITNATTAAMEFKGATATLPENPAKGDMYKVAGENINIKIDDVDAKLGDSIVYDGEKWFLIPSGDDIEDTWRPVDGVNNDATLKFVDGDKTVAAVAADGTIKYNHAAIDAPEDVTAEGDEKTRTYITAVETDGYGHITGYKTATENVEDTNTTYEFEGQAEESNVYFQVTSSEEGATPEVIYIDAYTRNEADGKFVEKVDGKQLSTEDFTTALLNKLNGIAEEANKYEHAEHTAYAEGFYKVTVDAEGHVSNAVAVTKEDIVALGIPGQDTTYEKATADADGLMSKEHFAKVEGIAEGATKVENVGDGKIKINDQEVTVYAHPEKHAIDDVTGLQDALDDKVEKVDGKGLSTNDLTDELKGQYDAAYQHAIVDHAPANAQENIIESVKVNGTALTITDKAVDITVPTGALAGKDKVEKTDLAGALATEIDNKVASVAAGDASVTVGGTATAPTVATKISADEGNALTLAEDGLKVIIPESTKVEASETNGNIKVDGEEVTVYTHPEKHAIADVDGLQDALNGKATTAQGAKADTALQFYITEEILAPDIDEVLIAGPEANSVLGSGIMVNDIATKATTLAGYGIADAYTKTEVENLLTWGEF